MVLSDNGKTSRYTYNAAGERIMKSYGTMEGVYINGAAKETAIRVHTIQVPGTMRIRRRDFIIIGSATTTQGLEHTSAKTR